MKAVLFVTFIVWANGAKADVMMASETASICAFENAPQGMHDMFQNSCMSWLRGFMAYHQTYVALIPPGSSIGKGFCLPSEGVSMGSVRTTFLSYVARMPNAAGTPDGLALMVALGDAYPCPQK